MRPLIGPETHELCAMAKPLTGEVVVLDFDDQLRLKRFPLARPASAPPAGTAGGISRKARAAPQWLKYFDQIGPVFRREAGCKADVIQETFVVIQPEQQ